MMFCFHHVEAWSRFLRAREGEETVRKIDISFSIIRTVTFTAIESLIEVLTGWESQSDLNH